jgi:hypothetical protein
MEKVSYEFIPRLQGTNPMNTDRLLESGLQPRLTTQFNTSLTNTAKIRPGTSLARFKDASHNQKKTRV